MPVHIPARRFGRSVPASRGVSTTLVLAALVLVLLVVLAAARRPSDADTIQLPVNVIGP